MKYWNIIQAILFYIIWFLSVNLISSNNINNELIAILLLLLFGFLSIYQSNYSDKILLAKIVFKVSLVGILLDFILTKLNLFSYINHQASLFNYPVWIIAMWFAFSTTYFGCLSWLLKSKFKAFIFGAIGGGLSLYSGTIFEVAKIANTNSLLPVALVWGVIVSIQSSIMKKSS